MSSDQVDEKMKKKAKKRNKNDNDNKEDRCLYVSDEVESRQNLQDLDVIKDKDKKKKKSKKQKRKELVDSVDLASQLRRDEEVGLLSGKCLFPEKFQLHTMRNSLLRKRKRRKNQERSKKTMKNVEILTRCQVIK